MNIFDTKGKMTIKGTPSKEYFELSSIMHDINKKPKATLEDARKIIYTIPGMEERNRYFTRRAKALQHRLCLMNMHHEDANNIAWLHTFHEMEEKPFKEGEHNG